MCEQNGISPLLIASCYRHDSTVERLLDKGADISLCTKNGCSPFFIACCYNHYNTVQLLLNNGANINLYPENEFCPDSNDCLFAFCQVEHMFRIFVNDILALSYDHMTHKCAYKT